MNPLVLFLIGGSGARFLRSLLYQLAAGLQLNDIDEILIVIIDTDESNGNYHTALTLLKQYQSIRNKIDNDSANFRDKDKSRLFYHKVSIFDERHIFITPLNAQKRTLGNLVDYTNLTTEQRDFVNLMLTRQELDEDLSIGFQGRPNMGTIGLEAIGPTIKLSSKLNHLMGDSPDLEAEGLKNAKFFTVSSMFGGMGASGMPMLINKFNKPNYNSIVIGSLCFMQYFKINDGKANNDSKYFPQRTYLAYEHYKNDFRNKLNMLYCIGKSFDNEIGVPFAPGKKEQFNKAHFIEFLSTTALIHFCNNRVTSILPRELKTFALHIKQVGNNIYANCLEGHYNKSIEDYIKLIFIAKYFTGRFEKSYNSDEMKEINWIKYGGFDKISFEDRDLLSQFFHGVLAFDWDELYTYSGLRILKSCDFPQNVSDILPHKNYTEYDPGFLAKNVKYNAWTDYDMKGITDKGVQSRDSIPRLLSILDRSFSSIYNKIYN